MKDQRYWEYSHRISKVKTAADGKQLGRAILQESKDGDRETLLRSLTQHMAMTGILEESEATA